MPGTEDVLFAKLALQQHFLAPEQITQALRMQADANGRGCFVPLGQILQNSGLLNEQQVRVIYEAIATNKDISKNEVIGL